MDATNKDVVLVVSLVLSLVSLVLLFGVTWYFQSSLDLLQQVEYDRELLLKLQEQVNVRITGKCVCSIQLVIRVSGMAILAVRTAKTGVIEMKMLLLVCG